jgi:hypothetical protein
LRCSRCSVCSLCCCIGGGLKDWAFDNVRKDKGIDTEEDWGYYSGWGFGTWCNKRKLSDRCGFALGFVACGVLGALFALLHYCYFCGGLMDWAFNYIKKNGCIDTEEDWGYYSGWGFGTWCNRRKLSDR